MENSPTSTSNSWTTTEALYVVEVSAVLIPASPRDRVVPREVAEACQSAALAALERGELTPALRDWLLEVHPDRYAFEGFLRRVGA